MEQPRVDAPSTDDTRFGFLTPVSSDRLSLPILNEP